MAGIAESGTALDPGGRSLAPIIAWHDGRGEETVAALRRHPNLEVDMVPIEGGAVVGEVLVSTIPAAAQTGAVLAAASGAQLVFEVVYDPWPTPLAAAARESGQVLVSGLDLLVHQAVLQFAEFTGQQGPLEAMRTAGEVALANR